MKSLFLSAVALIMAFTAVGQQPNWPENRLKAEQELGRYQIAFELGQYQAAAQHLEWFYQNAPNFA